MDGVSGASAVIALGGFVATTIQDLNKLLKDVRKAPEEMRGLIRYLEELEDSLTGTAEFIHQLNSDSDRNGFFDRIINAVEYCAEILKSIKVLIDKARGTRAPHKRLQNTLTSLKFVSKKNEIGGMQTQLDRAINRLNLAVSIDSLHQTIKTRNLVTKFSQSLMTEHKLSLLIHSSQSAPSGSLVADKKLSLLIDSSQSAPSARLLVEDDSSPFTDSSQSAPGEISLNSRKASLLIDSSKSAIRDKDLGLFSLDARRPCWLVSKASVFTWYNGILGIVNIQKNSKFKGNVLNVNARPISEETIIILRPCFLRNHYELHFVERFGHISRTLNVDRVVDYTDPVFEMCRSGDITGLCGEFCGGRASPYTVTPMGTGLLHCAAANYQLETCIWLLARGADADRVNSSGAKALTWIATHPSRYEDRVSTETVLDIVRLLAHRQEDLSAVDVSRYFEGYLGPPEGAKLMLSEYPVQYDRPSPDSCYGQTYPNLAAILRAYAREPSPWEPILRELIRRGADLHAPVRRDRRRMNDIGYPCHMAEYGSPLDELFGWNKDSLAARTAADGWLRILASEGRDAFAYLKEEFVSRTEEMHFTHPSITLVDYDKPRKLFFELGNRPSVFWDWWIDPASTTSLSHEEFKFLTTDSPDSLRLHLGWEENWPFAFPKWSNLHQGYAQDEKRLWQCEAMLAQADKRADRRTKEKAAKSARAQRCNRPRRIPGAWPM